MKKYLSVVLVSLILMITGCSNNEIADNTKNDEVETTANDSGGEGEDRNKDKDNDAGNSVDENIEETTKEETVDPVKEKVDEMMAKMSVEEKIAQMLILYYESPEVSDELIDITGNVKPGGYIIMGSNITTFDNTVKLIETMKDNPEVPVLITIDQEGGLVQRLKGLTDIKPTIIPDMYSVGSTEDEELAYSIGEVMALELRTLGVNLTFAPVVDILTEEGNTVIGNRSFSSDAGVVSKMSVALAKGLEENGVLTTYKHFPGHGDTTTDSHTDLPIINKTKDELYKEELIPFENAIDNGADMIMVGHIALPLITGDNTPASLSGEIITDLLKNEMGYKGLVVTDALNMGALTNTYSQEEIYVMAIEAGVDFLLMPGEAKSAIEHIKSNVNKERIDESVRKILEYKFTYLSDEELFDKSYLGCEEHQEVVDKVYE